MLTTNLIHDVALPVTSDPGANSIHNANVSVYQREHKILTLELMPGTIRKASASETSSFSSPCKHNYTLTLTSELDPNPNN